jgi:hypothetical protein
MGPLGVFCKDVIWKGLGVMDAQGCESREVMAECEFGRGVVDEKEGVMVAGWEFMGECSMGLPTCQGVLGRTVRIGRGRRELSLWDGLG